MQVWGITLIVPPIILFISMIIDGFPRFNLDVSIILYTIYTVALGALMAFPVILFYRFSIPKLTRLAISVNLVKLLLSTISVVYILTLSFLIDPVSFHSKDISDKLLPALYCLLVIVSGQVFSLTDKTSKTV